MKPPHTMERFKLPVTIELRCNSKIKKWAFDNAWTLIVMAIGFGITWCGIIYLGVIRSVNG